MIEHATRRIGARRCMVPAALTVAVLVCGAGLLVGCNIVGPALVLAEGPPKTEAQFQLDKNRTHIILVDDMKSRLPKRSLRDQIVQSAEETLLEEGILKPERLIGAQAVQRAMSDDRSGKPKPIVDIGKEAGASVVIYVTMDRWTIADDGRTSAPIVEARVKVLDCDENKRLWPPMQQGYTLRLSPKVRQSDMPADLAGRSKAEQELARRLGVSIAQLFFKHETSTNAAK